MNKFSSFTKWRPFEIRGAKYHENLSSNDGLKVKPCLVIRYNFFVYYVFLLVHHKLSAFTQPYQSWEPVKVDHSSYFVRLPFRTGNMSSIVPLFIFNPSV